MNKSNQITVKVLQMSWFNIYAPFYIAMCLLEKGCPEKKGNGPCNEDCELKKLCEKIKEINNNQIDWTFQFKDHDSDKDIINKFRSGTQNKTDDFVIGICDPMSIDENKDPLEITPFINRLPVYGFTNYDFASQEKGSNPSAWFDIFQSSINFRFREAMDKIFSSGKPIRIYSYPEGSTIFNLLLQGLKEDKNKIEVKSLLYSKILDEGKRPKNFEFEDYTVRYNENNYNGKKLKNTIKNVEFYTFTPGHLFFDILNKKKEDSVWIAFTVEPAEPFRIGWKDNLKLIYSSVPQLSNFTSIIWKKTKNSDKLLDAKNILKKALNESIQFFYANDFTPSVTDCENKRSAIKIIDDYFKQHMETDNGEQKEVSDWRGSAKVEANKTVAMLKHDVLEWEIFKNQRVYAFDIVRVAKQWQVAYEKVDEGIKKILENDGEDSHENKCGNPYDRLKKNVTDNQEILDKDIKGSVELLCNTLAKLYDQQILASKRSALAAIVSRNMSHNIGSHIINYLKHHVDIIGNSFKILFSSTYLYSDDQCGQMLQDWLEELKQNIDSSFMIKNNNENFLNPSMYAFLEYLNRRMEFIANLTTSVPSISSEMDFTEIIFKPLVDDNKFFSNFIAKSDLRKHVNGTIKQCELKIVPGDKPADQKGIRMSVPDGLVGTHAFYTILENFIRNSAKHGFAASNKNELLVTVNIYDHDNDYFRIRICDNLKNGTKFINKFRDFGPSGDSGNGKNETLDDHFLWCKTEKNGENEKSLSFSPKFLDQKGNLIHKLWGLKEMYIGACYLRGLFIEDYDTEHTPPVITVGVDKHGNLFFDFYMFKPKSLLILEDTTCDKGREYEDFSKTYQEYGTDLISYKELETVFPRHRFCLLCDCPKSKGGGSEKTFYVMHKNFLPLRVFCDCSRGKDQPYAKLELKNKWEKTDAPKDFDALFQDIYESWIKTFYGINELPEVIVAGLWEKNPPAWNNLITTTGKDTLKKKSDDENITGQASPAIVFVDHLTEDDRKNIKQNLIIDGNRKRLLTLENSTGRNSTKSLLENVDNPAVRKMEIIEAYLAKVIIIDERIYNNCDHKTYDAYWNWLDVKLYNFIPPGKNGRGGFEHRKDGESKIIDMNNFFENEMPFKNPKAHFLVIHRGIAEKIAESLKNQTEVEDVFRENYCQKIAENIIVTSGRGKPEYISKSNDLRFVNIENVYAWFFDCKFSLVQGLFSIINRKGKEENDK